MVSRVIFVPFLLNAQPFAEVLAYVYVYASASLFNALPLEAALASVHVCTLLFQTPCAEHDIQLQSLHLRQAEIYF